MNKTKKQLKFETEKGILENCSQELMENLNCMLLFEEEGNGLSGNILWVEEITMTDFTYAHSRKRTILEIIRCMFSHIWKTGSKREL